MRLKYVDNIRIICILLLFPFHTAMIYNNWNEAFYITGKPSIIASLFVTQVYPWWMTLLFTLAGVSSFHALNSKTNKEFIFERLKKLFVPFLFGIILIVSVQSYIADIFYNNYKGSYFSHLKIFFTKFTDLTGGDGGFTPGHLWFVLYLFVISLVMFPFMKKYINNSNFAHKF